MQWQSLDAFLSMGGYGFYVWVSFGLTVVCMAVELLLLRSRQRVLTNREQA
jgi:heme exporter protein D